MVTYTKRSQVPVDRGWAWVILVASFIGLFMMALVYISGIFQVVFLEVFQRDTFTTSWIFSINSSMLSFLGPLSSYMNRRFGSRVTVIIGSLVGTTGFVLTAFAETFWQIFLSYGIIVGTGFGIAYLPCAVSVSFYFEKYRNLVFGIINMSVGIAAMILSPLIQSTNEHYGWRGSMLILAGMFLQVCIVGAVLRPVDYSDELDVDLLEDNDMEQVIIDCSKSNGKAGLKPAEESTLSEVPVWNRHIHPLVYTSKSAHLGSLGVISNSSRRSVRERSYTSMAYPAIALLGSTADIGRTGSSSLSLALRRSKGKFVFESEESGVATSLNDVSIKRNAHVERLMCSEYNLTKNKCHERVGGESVKENHSKNVTEKVHNNGHIDISGKRLYQTRRCRSQLKTSESSHASYTSDTLSACLGNLGSTRSIEDDINKVAEPKQNKQQFQFSLFCNRPFCMFCLMQLLVCIAVSMAYQHLPYYVQSYGTTKEEAAILLFYAGLANCASRLLTGMAINSDSIDPLLVQIGSNGVMGTVFFFIPLLVQTYSGQVIFCLFFGFFANCYTSLFGPITIFIVGLEQLSNAYGVLLVLCGTGFLIGPPSAGAMYDATKSFQLSFITAGVCFILGAICMMLVVVGKPPPEATADDRTQLEKTKTSHLADS